GCTTVLVSADLSAHEQRTVLDVTGGVEWLGDLHLEAEDQLNANRIASEERFAHASTDGAPSVILMTSGTAGSPKGVHLTLHALIERVRLNREHIPAADMERTLCVLPAFFGHGLIGNCLTPLSVGSTLTLLDRPSVAEIATIGALIDEHQITFMSSVPSFWKVARKVSPKPKQSTLRRVHVGSAPLTAQDAEGVAEWCGTRTILNMYGMTEAANWISGGNALAEREEDPAPPDGYVGHPWGGKFAILDRDGSRLSEGRGEVLLQTPSIMEGYWKAPDKTDAAFVDGWFRTGDIGELDTQNGLRLVGRTKWEINRSGMKIQAEEVDALLERHPAVLEACAFGVPDTVSGEAVAAAIVLNDGGNVSTEDIRRWCRNEARRDVVPIWLQQLSDLPKNDRGKLDRAKTREIALALQAGP
ncbi:MAG: fatty acid--CoA ligase family protein, partial [Pseudomonadota bacterium]